MIAICQKWEEVEFGWGTRPFGCTLHASESDRVAFINEHQGRSKCIMEYSHPDGDPFITAVSDKETWDAIIQSRNGIRCRDVPSDDPCTSGWCDTKLLRKRQNENKQQLL